MEPQGGNKPSVITDESIEAKSGEWKTYYGYDDAAYKRSWFIFFGENPYPSGPVEDSKLYHEKFICFDISPEIHEDGSVTFTVYCAHPEVDNPEVDKYARHSWTHGFPSLKSAQDWCLYKLPERFKT